MLLQPRKFKRKSWQKRRNFKTWTYKSLVYGTSGLRIQQSMRMSSKQIYRLKLFLKKAVRKSDRTQRYMWSSWCTQLRPGMVLVEFKHLRYGRIAYFLKQIAYKSPVKVQPIISTMGSFTLNCVSRANITLIPFN